MTDAVIVGSGPNGLSAAVVLARAGVSVTVIEATDQIGGGTRTGELTVPGVLHDHCSAVHPLGIGSPFLREVDLSRHGLEWRWPQIDLAHPLDGGAAAVLVRSVSDTASGLGVDGPTWRRLFEPLARNFERLAEDILRPIAHRPRHPRVLTRFGLGAILPAAGLARAWREEPARALFAGLAAHSFRPLTAITTAAAGLVLGAAGHRYGWPVARGGSRAITDALAGELRAHGGRIETGRRVTALAEVGSADVVMLDLAPRGVLDIAGDRLPARVARAYGRYRLGPAAFKMDLAVQGGLPWTNDACRRAGTVHVGGTLAEIAEAERSVNAGRMPGRPYLLVAQQYLADASRSAGDIHPVWVYAHVPHGWTGDATPAIMRQLERFAPGSRERVVAQTITGPAQLAAANPNYVGGDIANGANDALQLLMRPRVAVDPYATGIPGVYLCSAATPPGAGVHGMCGRNAAESALRHLS